jgi:hypothetical protein
MRIVLTSILVLAVLSVPAPLATEDDPAAGPQIEREEPADEFIPTEEEVPADSSITFPVDI